MSNQQSTKNYKVVALDLDGTTLNNHHQLTEKTKQVLRGLHDKGVSVVIATGRSTPSIGEYFYQLQLRQPEKHAICFNGSSCVEFDESGVAKSALFSKTVEPNHARQLLDFAQQYGFVAQYYNPTTGEVTACPKTETHFELLRRYEKTVGKPQTMLESYEEVMNTVNAAKILLLSDDPHRVVDLYNQHFQVQPQADKTEEQTSGTNKFHVIVGSPDPFFVEFLPPDVCKGNGLKAYCELKGIDLKTVVAFGDGQNDKEFLQYSGIGVAMKNANEMAKQAADVICEWTNEEDGVALQLEKMSQEVQNAVQSKMKKSVNIAKLCSEAKWESAAEAIHECKRLNRNDSTAILNKKHSNGTALHFATLNGHFPTVKLLVEAGADVNGQVNGETCLHNACANNNVDIAEYLLENGADCNKQNKVGATPLHYGSIQGYIDVIKLLVEAGADVLKLDKFGTSALYHSCVEGRLDAVKYLIETAGADVNAVNKVGKTCLHIACNRHLIEIVEYLLLHSSVDLSIKDDEVIASRRNNCPLK